MSKILFTVALPHDSSSPSSSRTPQFFISCNNNTCLSMRGLDFKSARFGNSNVNPGWKNRFEYSVTASKTVTRFSLIVNTSIILPAMSWSSPYPAPKTPKQKKKRESSSGSSRSSKSSRSSNSDISNEKPRAAKESRDRPRIEDEEHGRYEMKPANSSITNQEGREHGPRQQIPREAGNCHESRPRIEDRGHQRDESRRVRWREREREDSSHEGSDSRTPRIYDGRDCRPRERRRKSRKVQDPGFADQMD